jgi:hypothetical protein
MGPRFRRDSAGRSLEVGNGQRPPTPFHAQNRQFQPYKPRPTTPGEFEGRSVLLPGDAHPGPLLDSIQRMLADRGADRLHLDVFVLPHGGSANNVLPELFEAVDAATYAICTDGSRYGFPRQETIEMLARVMQRPITVAFNYRSQTTAKFDDGYVRKELQLQPIYPEGSEGGLVLSLEAADRLAP